MVALAKEALAIRYAPGDSAGSVTRDLGLPLAGLYQVQVAWQSSLPGAIAQDGRVSRPDAANAPVALTATLTLGAASDQVVFHLTVLGMQASVASHAWVQASGSVQSLGPVQNAVVAGESITAGTGSASRDSNRTGFTPPLPGQP
jgi:hypothetical protein